MARQRVVPTSPPTIPPDKSIPILESHIAEADKLRSEVPHSPARQEWIQTGECALTAALGEDNPTVHSFGVAQFLFSIWIHGIDSSALEKPLSKVLILGIAF